ncbi:MAG: hypothetical protein SFX72_11705 [Isosphaeraceae bacterium]|nr:hypothetical protein [Isosphaeraceae bacterium]
MSDRLRAGIWVFAILLPSAGFFQHSRDWNTASRLMLTYALVDRGTLSINGLENQTGDKAVQGGRFYSDKLPGYSFLAAGPYATVKLALGLPPHPLGGPAIAHFASDAWVAFLTSGLLTAATGALIAGASVSLGVGPRTAVAIGLAYGLATPAALYAGLAYGHQPCAFALFAAFLLIARPPSPGRERAVALLAGLLASYASVIELQVGPVSAILGFQILGLVLARRRPASMLAWFALGAAIPAMFMCLYHYLAFGSPFTLGYFLHAEPRFRAVHSASNPLGVAAIDWSLADDLLWGTRRGLIVHAPITALAPLGFIALARRGRWSEAIAAPAICAAVFLVNLSYPEWTGGWSTGPRLLLPLLPFAMLGVAGFAAVAGRLASTAIAALGILGWFIMLAFVGVGGRIPEQSGIPGGPDPFAFPLRDVLPPIWSGGPVPGWLFGRRFAKNLVEIAFPEWVGGLSHDQAWLQFVPLVGFQAVMVVLMLVALRPNHQAASDSAPEPQAASTD